MVAGEVIGIEEEGDAAAGLMPDACDLCRSGRAGQQQRGAPLRRRDPHPALGLALAGVFEQLEAEHAGEPGDRLVVVADDEGDCGERAHAGALPSASTIHAAAKHPTDAPIPMIGVRNQYLKPRTR